MKKSALLVAFGALILLGSCDKTPEDQIIIGQYYGMCQGPGCIAFYKVSDGIIYENTTDAYPQGTGPVSYTYAGYTGTVPQGLLSLKDEVPQALYSQPEVIGIPDAYDQGGLYFEIVEDGNSRFWRIDMNLDSVPPQIQQFCTDIKEYLVTLN